MNFAESWCLVVTVLRYLGILAAALFTLRSLASIVSWRSGRYFYRNYYR